MIRKSCLHTAIRRLTMSVPQDIKPYKIAVVGAGASGLGAARWLLDNMVDSSPDHPYASSIEVTVLEARNRIGGRVHTYAPEDATAKGLYDVGASWIHDPSDNPLTIMAKSMKLKTKETDFGEEIVTDLKGKRYDDGVSYKTFTRYEKVLFSSAAAARKAGVHDKSLGEVLSKVLDMSSPLHNLYISGLEFELGTPLSNCSASECIDDDWLAAVNGVGDSNSAHLPSYHEPCDLLLHECGYSELMDGLSTGAATDHTTMQPGLRRPDITTNRVPINIRLNHEVVSIVQQEPMQGGRSGLVVTTRNRVVPSNILDTAAPGTVFTGTSNNTVDAEEPTSEYTFDAVIVTVPLGVLKASSITFTPPLSPAKQAAIEQVGFGNVVKIIMEFSQVFWPTHTPFLSLADAALASPSQRGLLTYFLNGHNIAGKKVLVSYGLGEAADVVDKMSDEELTQLVMSRMASIALPGRKLPAAPLRIVRTRWSKDPFARGVYSYWATGNRPGIRAELGRREGNVWFAGEAVQESSLLSSSVQGAWLSGVAAAVEVCQHLQVPVTLSTTLAPIS